MQKFHFINAYLVDNCIIAGKCGAIEAVVGAIKKHLGNAGVCESGCVVLQNITTNCKLHHLHNFHGR